MRADGTITATLARAALELYEVDELGLDRLDRAVLRAMCTRFAGGPVGLSTLAISVGEERETVEEVAEPFLVRQGFLMRTPRGRVATPAAWRHLGLAVPGGATAPDAADPPVRLGHSGGAEWVDSSGRPDPPTRTPRPRSARSTDDLDRRAAAHRMPRRMLEPWTTRP